MISSVFPSFADWLFTRIPFAIATRASMGCARAPALPSRIAHPAAKRLVLVIVGAERVAVHEERALPVEIDHGGIFKELDPGLGGETAGDQEIPIPVHEIRRDSGFQEACDAAVEREREPIVADPVLEEVAEDVERVGPGRRGAQEPFELRGRLGPRFVEMKVRDE
jgi:hypothetical protein